MKITPHTKEIPRITLNKLIKNKQDSLTSEDIVSVDLKLSRNELATLKRFKIQKDGISGNFLYWGNVFTKDFEKEIETYLKSLGSNAETDVQMVSDLIIRTVQNTANLFFTDLAWIEMKTFFPSTTFRVPRWHVDNKFFHPLKAYKLICTLKGAKTRFGNTKKINDFKNLTSLEVLAGHGTKRNIEVRKKLDSIVDEMPLSKFPLDAILYKVGAGSFTIHSEPEAVSERLFLAVVPGSKKEIELWYKKKKKKDAEKGVVKRIWWKCEL